MSITLFLHHMRRRYVLRLGPAMLAVANGDPSRPGAYPVALD